MTRILLTGGTGYIGSSLIQCFTKEQMEFAVLSRNKSREFLLPKGTCSLLLDEAFKEERQFDVIIHLGYGVGLGTSDTIKRNQHTLDGVVRLAAAHGARLVYASSVAVFGYSASSNTNFLSPITKLSRDDTYTYAKGALERYVGKITKKNGVPLSVVRIGNVMGPSSVWARIIAGRVAKGQDLPMDLGQSNSTSISNLCALLCDLANGINLAPIVLSTEFADISWRDWAEAVVPEELRSVIYVKQLGKTSEKKSSGYLKLAVGLLQAQIMQNHRLKRLTTSMPNWALRKGKVVAGAPLLQRSNPNQDPISWEVMKTLTSCHSAPVYGCKKHSFEETASDIRRWARWANYFVEYERYNFK